MSTGKALSWLVALAGLWEVVAPFVLGYTTGIAMYNAIIVGIVLIILGVWAALSSNSGADRTLNWVSAVVGLWLILSPFVLGFSITSVTAMTDAIIVGIIVIILGVWAAIQFRTQTPHPV